MTPALRPSCTSLQVFKGADGMLASVPSEKATGARGDVLLAYELNGAPIPPHHGAPLRAVVPGHVGVRNVKWLDSVEASAEEAEGPWQRGIAYKGFNPSITSVEGLDVERIPSVQEQPVTSVIAEPAEGSVVDPDWKVVTVRGYAYSGGGRGIVRVDVSADGGKSWTSAQLKEGSEQPLTRAWAWTFWEADVPLPPEAEAKGAVEVVCKATDAAYNVQPEKLDGIWRAALPSLCPYDMVPLELPVVGAVLIGSVRSVAHLIAASHYLFQSIIRSDFRSGLQESERAQHKCLVQGLSRREKDGGGMIC